MANAKLKLPIAEKDLEYRWLEAEATVSSCSSVSTASHRTPSYLYRLFMKNGNWLTTFTILPAGILYDYVGDGERKK